MIQNTDQNTSAMGIVVLEKRLSEGKLMMWDNDDQQQQLGNNHDDYEKSLLKEPTSKKKMKKTSFESSTTEESSGVLEDLLDLSIRSEQIVFAASDRSTKSFIDDEEEEEAAAAPRTKIDVHDDDEDVDDATSKESPRDEATTAGSHRLVVGRPGDASNIEPAANNTAAVVKENGGSSERERKVNFSTIEIRDYPIIIGVNPAVSMGVPLTIDWQHDTTFCCDVDEYEETKPPSRSMTELRMPMMVRESLCRRLDFSRRAIMEGTKAANVGRSKRKRTLETLNLAPLQEGIERSWRATSNATFRRAAKKQERRYFKECEVRSKPKQWQSFRISSSRSVMKAIDSDDDDQNTIGDQPIRSLRRVRSLTSLRSLASLGSLESERSIGSSRSNSGFSFRLRYRKIFQGHH